jgi:myosin heavy subunit
VQLTICEEPEKKEEEKKETAFSQEQVNKFLAEEKRKWQTTQQKTISELTEIKNQLSTSDEEKTALSKKISEMETQLLTKEEIAEREKKKMETEAKNKIDSLSAERDNFKNQYANYRIENEITQEAVSQEAFSPKQVVALLRNETRLVPVVGEDKKPTGEFAAVVAIKSIKEGKQITLELPIADAVKRMKETPTEFGNLFKSTMSSGVGGGNVPGNNTGLNSSDFKDPANYRKNRQAITS